MWPHKNVEHITKNEWSNDEKTLELKRLWAEECVDDLNNTEKDIGKEANVHIRFANDDIGYGLYLSRNVETGTSICSYSGIITATKPEKESNYLMEFSDGFIDASEKGSRARFINHSCKNYNVIFQSCILNQMPQSELIYP